MHTGKLIHGFEYQDMLQRDFEMREVTNVGELFDAEIEAGGIENQLAFNGALMARQLVRIGACEGPFTLEQIRRLKPADYQVLRAAQGKLSSGPGESSKSADDSGTKSP